MNRIYISLISILIYISYINCCTYTINRDKLESEVNRVKQIYEEKNNEYVIYILVIDNMNGEYNHDIYKYIVFSLESQIRLKSIYNYKIKLLGIIKNDEKRDMFLKLKNNSNVLKLNFIKNNNYNYNCQIKNLKYKDYEKSNNEIIIINNVLNDNKLSFNTYDSDLHSTDYVTTVSKCFKTLYDEIEKTTPIITKEEYLICSSNSILNIAKTNCNINKINNFNKNKYSLLTRSEIEDNYEIVPYNNIEEYLKYPFTYYNFNVFKNISTRWSNYFNINNKVRLRTCIKSIYDDNLCEGNMIDGDYDYIVDTMKLYSIRLYDNKFEFFKIKDNDFNRVNSYYNNKCKIDINQPCYVKKHNLYVRIYINILVKKNFTNTEIENFVKNIQSNIDINNNYNIYLQLVGYGYNDNDFIEKNHISYITPTEEYDDRSSNINKFHILINLKPRSTFKSGVLGIAYNNICESLYSKDLKIDISYNEESQQYSELINIATHEFFHIFCLKHTSSHYSIIYKLNGKKCIMNYYYQHDNNDNNNINILDILTTKNIYYIENFFEEKTLKTYKKNFAKTEKDEIWVKSITSSKIFDVYICKNCENKAGRIELKNKVYYSGYNNKLKKMFRNDTEYCISNFKKFDGNFIPVTDNVNDIVNYVGVIQESYNSSYDKIEEFKYSECSNDWCNVYCRINGNKYTNFGFKEDGYSVRQNIDSLDICITGSIIKSEQIHIDAGQYHRYFDENKHHEIENYKNFNWYLYL